MLATVAGVSHIRRAEPDDRQAIYDVCRLTGDAGQDATEKFDDPLLLGHVYAWPYVRFEPELAFVVADDEGVGGYVLGALDVVSFAARLEREWWPGLRAQYPDGGDYRASDRRLVEMIHRPRSGSAHHAAHPSELHIDLLPRCQGTGAGRQLMSTLLDALRAAGSPGVHLGVDPRNTHACGFYRHLGFDEHRTDRIVTFTLDL